MFPLSFRTILTALVIVTLACVAASAQERGRLTGRVLESSKVIAEHNLAITGMMPRIEA